MWVKKRQVKVMIGKWSGLNWCNRHGWRCVVGANMVMSVDVREWSWLNVCESACGLGEIMLVNVDVRE